jgi:glycine cleavage system H lipoate-binding protein
MLSHEFLSIYPAKLAEYCLGIGYMLAFIGWWKFVNGGKREEAEMVLEHHEPATTEQPWFQIPADVWLHPGHTWARAAADGTVAVGLDDFASKLVGPVEKVALPRPGAPVGQGIPAVALAAGGKSVPMLSPVDGVVAEVNEELLNDPALLANPYVQGWLFKVRPARLRANERQLLGAERARAYLDEAAAALAAKVSPDLGHVLQDGGTPVAGIAQELEPERWDELARSFFLTQGA